MQVHPPRLAESLLRRVLSPEDAEVITGDLEETFRAIVVPRLGARRARRWYWRQAISIVCSRLAVSAGDSLDYPVKDTTMAVIRQDLIFAMRSLWQRPGFAAAAVLMLALGIGGNVAVFSVVRAVLLAPLPFAEPERLMLVHMLSPDRDAPGVSRPMIWSYPKYEVLREHQRVFESTGLFAEWIWNVTGSDTPERVTGELVESSYFGVLGLDADRGRTFSAEETRAPGSAPLVVLGHGFWVRRYGGDPGVLGRTIGLNGVPHTIVGVLPPRFRGLTGQADLWVPLMTLRADDLGEAWNHSYSLVARRKPDVSQKQAEAAVTALGRQIDEQIPDPGGRRGGWGALAVPLNDERVDVLTRQSVLLMAAAVGCVLLIVCVNLANLMLVRALARQREVAIRLALGASRLRIVGQFMTESLVLAILGAAAGIAVGYGLIAAGTLVVPDLRMVLTGRTAGLTRIGLSMVGLDAVTLLFAAAIAGSAALLFGLGPAWRASRRDLTATMRAGTSGAVSEGTHGFSLRNLLIVGEMALALVLLGAGGLMTKSFLKLQATELGFRPDDVLTVRVGLPSPQYDQQRATLWLEQIVERLSRHPDIVSVAYGSCSPVSGFCNGTTIRFPDRPPVAPGTNPPVAVLWASPRYFETLGVPIVRGRVFSDRDRVGQPKVVVINETAARAFWGAEDPIGKRVAVGQGGFGDGAEVVGIVADVRYGAVEKSIGPDVYLPLLQSRRWGGILFIKSKTALSSLVPAVRQEVRALDPDLPLVDIKTMADRVGDATWRARISAWLLGTFAALALVLAAIGIYGVTSQGVEQRRREIGVRMAIGAGRPDIMRLVIGRVFTTALVGLALGIAIAIPSMRLLTALLYQVSPGDPVVFVALGLVLLAVAGLAGYLPARRAARVDPLLTLRAE